MQGRLSPLVDGRIQAFPADTWREEFPAAASLGLRHMEWTLDQQGLHDNPLMTSAGQAEVRHLHETHGVDVPSVTGDCFMQAPFWKAAGDQRSALQDDFFAVCRACAAVGVRIVVVPLVDGGRLESAEHADTFVEVLTRHVGLFEQLGLSIVVESDFAPEPLARFIERLPQACFGINYDIGNSAALGFDPVAEMTAYGHRILNVHVKDRPRGGTTVPLGTGDVDFSRVAEAFAATSYDGLFILQTARATDGDHAGALARFRDFTTEALAL